MDAIVLRPYLLETLEHEARVRCRSANDLVDEGIEAYVRQLQGEKIDRESRSYEAMHSELVQKYFGQWVAVHDGELVDHDEDATALYLRVRARYGRISVLLREVTERPVEEIRLRTWSTGKIPR